MSNLFLENKQIWEGHDGGFVKDHTFPLFCTPFPKLTVPKTDVLIHENTNLYLFKIHSKRQKSCHCSQNQGWQYEQAATELKTDRNSRRERGEGSALLRVLDELNLISFSKVHTHLWLNHFSCFSSCLLSGVKLSSSSLQRYHLNS